MRAIVLLLLLANVLFFAWSGGALDGVAGVPAHGDREPDRLARQVRSQAIRVLPASTVATRGAGEPLSRSAGQAASSSASAPPAEAAAASAALPSASGAP